MVTSLRLGNCAIDLTLVSTNGSPLQYSCLENPMDGGAWWAAVHGFAKSRTWLSYFTFTFHSHTLEKEKATHSSVLAWRIPGTGEPGGLPSLGSHRVGHDWSDLAAAAQRKLIYWNNALDIYYANYYNSRIYSTRRRLSILHRKYNDSHLILEDNFLWVETQPMWCDSLKNSN